MEYGTGEGAVIDVARWAGIRRRRWFFWSLVLGYMPVVATVLHFTESNKLAAVFFVAWALLLVIAVSLVAIAKCPACGNNFSMRNGSLSFSARCRHCGLHVQGEPAATSTDASGSDNAIRRP